MTCKISTDPKVVPVVRAPHRVSHAMRDRVESMLNSMVSMGVLEAVSEPTGWIPPWLLLSKRITVCASIQKT